MVISRRLSVFLSALVVVLGAHGQEPAFSIRLHNEQIYFADSPIDVELALRNESAETQRFRLADSRVFSFAFDARDANNRRVSNANDFTIRRLSNQVFYRTVTLEPGEELTLTERLTDYVSFERSGTYTVSAVFYPGMYDSPESESLVSNTITLTIRPGFTEETRQDEQFRAAVERQLQRQRLSPDEVVSYMLLARQQDNWERFFLYLNLEQLYRQDDARDRAFRRLSEEQQLAVLRDFREELMGDAADTTLVLVPDRFEIIETRYTPTEGAVVAELDFMFEQFREIKRYTYRLQRRNGFWEIIAYNVVNLANEAR